MTNTTWQGKTLRFIGIVLTGITIGAWDILVTIKLVRGTCDSYKTCLYVLRVSRQPMIQEIGT